jgi:hydrogenase large subunit
MIEFGLSNRLFCNYKFRNHLIQQVYIRNMMIGAQYVHDHVMHFYHLHALDWVDVVSALSGDPAKTAAFAKLNYPTYKPNNGKLPDAAYFTSILTKLNGLVSRGQLGLFANGYWGHPAYILYSFKICDFSII